MMTLDASSQIGLLARTPDKKDSHSAGTL